MNNVKYDLVKKLDASMGEVAAEAMRQLTEGDGNRAQFTVRALDALRSARSDLYNAAHTGFDPTHPLV